MTMPEEPRSVPMRLQRFLARSGVASRRGSENLMTSGRVRVNGEVVSELGSRVDPATDSVTVDGRTVHISDVATFLILNKPSGYLTTMRDPAGRPCVAELVPVDVHPGLFPVGRLDADTTGLLLFTTDGMVAQRLLHPSFVKDKHYVALVRGKMTPSAAAVLEQGITLEDGPCAGAVVERNLTGAAARPVAPHGIAKDCSVVGITVHEGRKHQVKRMLESVGHEVLMLHRDAFGPLWLGGLKQGQWRSLTHEETSALLDAAKGESTHG